LILDAFIFEKRTAWVKRIDLFKEKTQKSWEQY
jgi:hypothetical protein